MTQKTNWQTHEAFMQLSPQKQKMILSLAEALNGKNITEALPLVMQWRQQLAAQNMVFTAQETAHLTEFFMAQLSPTDKKQFETMKRFMG